MPGYTMLEVMIVITIAGILTAMSIPGFKETLDRNSRDGAMMDLMTSISRARQEAVSQGHPVSMCRSTNFTACAASTGGDWTDGWIVFSDTGTAGTLDGTDAIVQVHNALNKQSKVLLLTRTNTNFTGDYLRFDSNGFLLNSTSGAYYRLCSIDKTVSKARAVWLANTGRPMLANQGTNGSTGNYKDLAGADLVCP
ncbi:MAG TPA: GspH/FimT family pseudopilin [Candidatus Acidoferrum sp.]|nr:GspH/FimT family pseudopilin [Candidatus Acidoferrum sp.]